MKNYKASILNDQSTNVDEFGSHIRIASSLKQIIANEQGGKTIGLVGTWGSGKSTIISLLKNAIQSDPNINNDIKFISFDAWAHEGDPLRRSFLERLTLELKDWIQSDAKWDTDKLKELKRQKRISKSSKFPELTWWGIFILLSFFAVPFGLELFKKWTTGFLTHDLFLGITLTLAPVILCFLLILIKQKDAKKIIFLLINKKIETETEQTEDSFDPTSIEFEEYYNLLLSASLTKNINRKICIVVENIDRVTETDAIKLIATLKPFLQSSDDDVEWKKRIFYIIPFDARSVTKLWNDDPKTAQVFLEKLFQIRFYVPLQLLTDWQSFFAKKIKEAFHGIDEDTVYKLQRIYEISIDGTERWQPTPRQIIIFINQLVGIYSQWGDEIVIEHQSVFVVLRYYKNVDNLENIDDEINKLQNISEFCRESKIKDDLSGLYFNIDPNKARQYWLNTTVSNALTNADNKYFLENHDGLDINVIIETALNRSINAWLNNEPRLVLNCILALEKTVYINPYKRLLRTLERISQWQFLNTEYGELLSRIILQLEDEETRSKIILSLGTTGKLDDSQAKNNTQTYYEGLATIINKCIINNKANYFDKFVLNTDFETFCTLASLTNANIESKEVSNYIRLQRSKYSETVKKLLATFDDNSYNQKYSLALALFCKLATTQWHETIATKIIEKLGNNTSLNADEQSHYLFVILVLQKQHIGSDDKVQAILKEKLLSSWIYHWLQHANQSKNKTNMAICVTLICSDTSIAFKNQGGLCQNGYNYFVTTSQLPNLLKQDSEYINEIIKLIVEHDLIEKILENGQDAELNYRQIINPVVLGLMRHDEYKLLISPKMIFYRFDYLYGLSSADTEKLTKAAVDIGLLEEVLKYNEFMIDDLRLYNTILDTDSGKGNDKIRKWLADGLMTVKYDDWKESLEKESLLKKLIVAISVEAGAKFGDPLYSVLIELIENVSIGKKDTEYIEDGLKDYLLLLDLDHLITFKKECRDIIFKIENVEILSFFFQSFQFLTTEENILVQKADDFVLHIFDKTITSSLDAEIIYRLLNNCPNVWKKAESSSKKVFIQKLDSKIKEDDSIESLNKLKAKIVEIALK